MAYIRKFQEGGVAPAGPATGAPAGGEQDPVQILAEMAMQSLQGQDCQMAMQVCEGFIALIQQAMGGGPEPVGQAPEGEPVFKKGGKIAGRKKCKKKEDGGVLKNKYGINGDTAFDNINAKKVKIKM